MSWTSATAAAEPRGAPAPDAAGHWPAARSPTLDWLVGEARLLPNGRSLLRALCERLVAAGLPLARASFHIRILHPQLFGMGYYWQRGSDEIRVFRAEHGIQETVAVSAEPDADPVRGRRRGAPAARSAGRGLSLSRCSTSCAMRG